jgi:putative ABC transport system permease protein
MILFDKDSWQEIMSVLTKNKLRTFLTAFGVIWGVFMLIVMLGAGNGLSNGMNRITENLTTNGLEIEPGKTTRAYKGFNRDRQVKLYNEDIDILKKQIPQITHVAGGVYVNQSIVTRNALTGSFGVTGMSDEFQYIDRFQYDFGRFLNYTETKDFAKVAVIGHHVYEQLFKEGGDPTGKYIKINGIFFMIIGQFTSTHDGGWADFQNNSIFIPHTTAQRTFQFGNQLFFMEIAADNSIGITDLIPKIRMIISSIHKVDPNDKEAYKINDYSSFFKQMSNVMLGISILIWIVGTFTLIAGIIGISNIMLIVVKERTKEIGIKRALGATPQSIISQILLESAFLTTISGYIGFLLAIGLLELANKATQNAHIPIFRDPHVSFGIAISCITILIIGGILAGLIPARRAISIKPIDAIRE